MKTATELGIEEWELLHLKEVKRLLEGQALRHTPHIEKLDKLPVEPNFSMNYSSGEYRCGTVACIGGWMKILQMFPGPGLRPDYLLDEKEQMEVDKYVDAGRSLALADLFYPDEISPEVDGWDLITPAQAAKAIGNFLEHGKPMWKEATA
jgi:hypothetical protein